MELGVPRSREGCLHSDLPHSHPGVWRPLPSLGPILNIWPHLAGDYGPRSLHGSTPRDPNHSPRHTTQKHAQPHTQPCRTQSRSRSTMLHGAEAAGGVWKLVPGREAVGAAPAASGVCPLQASTESALSFPATPGDQLWRPPSYLSTQTPVCCKI